jgi:hypothetical protein
MPDRIAVTGSLGLDIDDIEAVLLEASPPAQPPRRAKA